jgi:hypothetical protein
VHLYIDSDTTIAGLLSQATAAEDATFGNRYCRVCRIGGDTIVHVRDGPDSAMVKGMRPSSRRLDSRIGVRWLSPVGLLSGTRNGRNG